MESLLDFLHSYVVPAGLVDIGSAISAIAVLETICFVASLVRLAFSKIKDPDRPEWGVTRLPFPLDESHNLPCQASGSFLVAFALGATLYHLALSVIARGSAPILVSGVPMLAPAALSILLVWVSALAVMECGKRGPTLASMLLGVLLGGVSMYTALYFEKVVSLDRATRDAMLALVLLAAVGLAAMVASALWHAQRSVIDRDARRVLRQGAAALLEEHGFGDGPVLSGFRWLAALPTMKGAPSVYVAICSACAIGFLIAVLPFTALMAWNSPGLLSYDYAKESDPGCFRYHVNIALNNQSIDSVDADGNILKTWRYFEEDGGGQRVEGYSPDGKLIGLRVDIKSGSEPTRDDLKNEILNRDLEYYELRYLNAPHSFYELSCERGEGGAVEGWTVQRFDTKTGNIYKKVGMDDSFGWVYTRLFDYGDDGALAGYRSVSKDEKTVLHRYTVIRSDDGTFERYQEVDASGNFIEE